jgi:hypothetical protein
MDDLGAGWETTDLEDECLGTWEMDGLGARWDIDNLGAGWETRDAQDEGLGRWIAWELDGGWMTLELDDLVERRDG